MKVTEIRDLAAVVRPGGGRNTATPAVVDAPEAPGQPIAPGSDRPEDRSP